MAVDPETQKRFVRDLLGSLRPEVRRRLAEAATARLQGLLNQGPFEMVGRVDEMQDRPQIIHLIQDG